MTKPPVPQGPGGLPYPGYTDGDPVLYRNEVWYCDGFMGANFVRIRSKRRYVPVPGGDDPTIVQAVPAGAVAPLPEERKSKSLIKPIRTEKAVEAAARAKAGQKSVGDSAASLLDGKDYAAMCKVVAEKTGEKPKELEAKYAHLDAGRRRMVLGNKLRSWLSKHGG